MSKKVLKIFGSDGHEHDNTKDHEFHARKAEEFNDLEDQNLYTVTVVRQWAIH